MGIIVLENGRRINQHYDKDGKYEKYGEINSGELMTIQNEAYSIKDLLNKFTTGVYTPAQMELAGMDPGEEFEESIMNSEVPELIDRTDAEAFVSSVNGKLSSYAKSKKAKTTTKSVADEAKDEQKEDEQDDDAPL